MSMRESGYICLDDFQFVMVRTSEFEEYFTEYY
jgi:hypothetical protein